MTAYHKPRWHAGPPVSRIEKRRYESDGTSMLGWVLLGMLLAAFAALMVWGPRLVAWAVEAMAV